MKCYFFIKDLFGASLMSESDVEIRMNLYSLKIDNVNVLTPAFTNEITPQFVNSSTFFKTHCDATTSINGVTTINSIGGVGFVNWFNPFVECLGLSFPSINGFPVGASNGTISGNSYGIVENTGIGVDSPIAWTDIGYQLGWSGNTQSCPFFMDIDFTKDFEMIFILDYRNPQNPKQITKVAHAYLHNAGICQFAYLTSVANNAGEFGEIENHTNLAFLSPNPEKGHLIPSCSISPASCEGHLTKARGLIIRPFKPVLGDDRGFKSCCFENYAFASSSDDEPRKNDFKSWLFKRTLPSDTFELKLIKNGGGIGNEFAMNNNTYGTFYDFGDVPDRPDYFGYQLEWKKVLLAHGEGSYNVILSGSIMGAPINISSSTYALREFSPLLADGTVRIDSVMNSILKFTGMDYRGLNWRNSIRFDGFFGNQQRSYDFEELTYSGDDKVEDLTMEQSNTYVLQGNVLPDCITEEIYDYHLFADELFAFDYNGNNHTYIKYNGLPIRLKENKDAEYYSTCREMTLNVDFADRFRDKRKTLC